MIVFFLGRVNVCMANVLLVIHLRFTVKIFNDRSSKALEFKITKFHTILALRQTWGRKAQYREPRISSVFSKRMFTVTERMFTVTESNIMLSQLEYSSKRRPVGPKSIETHTVNAYHVDELLADKGGVEISVALHEMLCAYSMA